jgi:hypothetical protein
LCITANPPRRFFGSEADIEERPPDVCFTPKSGHPLSELGCPLCAKSGLMHCSNLLMSSQQHNTQSLFDGNRDMDGHPVDR